PARPDRLRGTARYRGGPQRGNIMRAAQSKRAWARMLGTRPPKTRAMPPQTDPPAGSGNHEHRIETARRTERPGRWRERERVETRRPEPRDARTDALGEELRHGAPPHDLFADRRRHDHRNYGGRVRLQPARVADLTIERDEPDLPR